MKALLILTAAFVVFGIFGCCIIAGEIVRGRRYIEQKAKEKLDADYSQERFLK